MSPHEFTGGYWGMAFVLWAFFGVPIVTSILYFLPIILEKMNLKRILSGALDFFLLFMGGYRKGNSHKKHKYL